MVLRWSRFHLLSSLPVISSYHLKRDRDPPKIHQVRFLISHSPSTVSAQVMGFQVQLRYAIWLELVLISVLVHNASFLGHLCGILAGILYVEVPAILHLMNLLTGATLFSGRQRPSYTYSSGASSAPRASGRDGGYDRGRMTAAQQQSPLPSAYDVASDPGAAEEAAIQEALRRSMVDSTGSGGGGNVSDRDNQGSVPVVGNSGMSATWNAEPSRDAAAATEILGPAPTAPPPDELENRVVGASGGVVDMGQDELRRRRLQRLERLQRLGGGT